ncbi:MAG: site-specific integrase [Candidatus Pacearchaeota archaeon]|jgi:integrase
MTKFSISSVEGSNVNKSFLELTKERMQRGVDINIEKAGINKKYLKQYASYSISKNDTLTSVYGKVKTLRYFFDFVKKDAKKVTKRDVENFIANGWKTKKKFITYSNDIKHKVKVNEWSPRTRDYYKINIKYFYWWLNGCKIVGKEKVFPKSVSWLEAKSRGERRYIQDSEIITKDEMAKVINNALCLRDRCFLQVLYESGTRISECIGIRIKDITWDEFGCKVNVEGKTGQRKIRLVQSAPVLKQWLNEHPNYAENKNVEKEVFISLRTYYGNPITSQTAYKIVAGAVKRAGIKKNIHPHSFRHSRITELAKNNYTEEYLRVFAGWAKDSDMPGVYVHIGEKELDNRLLADAGFVKKDENKINPLKPIICFRCEEPNDFKNKFCSRCGQLLNEEAWKDFMKLFMRKEFSSQTGKPIIVSSVIGKDGKPTDKIDQESLLEEYGEIMKKIRDENRL